MRVNIQNVMTNVVVGKRNEIDVSMVENIFAKKKAKRRELNVNIGDYSWEINTIWWISCKCDLVGVMAGTHERFAFTTRKTWDFVNFGPWQFLD